MTIAQTNIIALIIPHIEPTLQTLFLIQNITIFLKLLSRSIMLLKLRIMERFPLIIYNIQLLLQLLFLLLLALLRYRLILNMLQLLFFIFILTCTIRFLNIVFAYRPIIAYILNLKTSIVQILQTKSLLTPLLLIPTTTIFIIISTTIIIILLKSQLVLILLIHPIPSNVQSIVQNIIANLLILNLTITTTISFHRILLKLHVIQYHILEKLLLRI